MSDNSLDAVISADELSTPDALQRQFARQDHSVRSEPPTAANPLETMGPLGRSDIRLDGNLVASERSALRNAVLKAADWHYQNNQLGTTRDFLALLEHGRAHTPETLQTLGNIHFLLKDFH